MTVHTDVLEVGWQWCDNYDKKENANNYWIDGWFSLEDMITIYYNQFNIVNLSIVRNSRDTIAYITYGDEGARITID